MAITTRTNLKVYDPRTQGAYRERNAQVIEVFNGASQNTIKLSTVSKAGDFDIEAFFRRETAIVARRDPTSLAAQTDANVTQDERVGVKVNRKIVPFTITADALRKIEQSVSASDDPEDAVMFALGGAVSDAVMQDKINTAIGAHVAALSTQADMINDTSASAGGVTTSKLNTTLFKRGDRSADIKAFVMHSAKFAELVDQQISTNATGVASVVMAGGNPLTFNRPVLVTDSPSLIVTGAPNKYWTLGLTDAAIEVEDTEEELIVGQWVTGLENLAMRMQGEYAYNLNLSGFSYVMASGANPTNAALNTGANWSMVVQSAKNIGGVGLLTQ